MKVTRQQKPLIPMGYEYLKNFVESFVKEHPQIDKNVFVMMPFNSDASDLIYQAVERELNNHGLVPLRADNNSFVPDLWLNVVTHMIGSSYGIAIFEPTDTILFNPNVSIEAGFMSALDKPVLFLTNTYLKKLPVDFSGLLFKTFSPSNIDGSIKHAISDWVLRDISYYNFKNKKVVVFVSLGGTCRCVLAKALLSEKLCQAKVSTIEVEAAALADLHHATISPSGVAVLKKQGYEKWIEHHRPRKLSPYLQERADLIIVLTDPKLLRTSIDKEKFITDVDLFGKRITNPYPDTEDEAALQRYKNTKDELDNALEKSLSQIIKMTSALPAL